MLWGRQWNFIPPALVSGCGGCLWLHSEITQIAMLMKWIIFSTNNHNTNFYGSVYNYDSNEISLPSCASSRPSPSHEAKINDVGIKSNGNNNNHNNNNNNKSGVKCSCHSQIVTCQNTSDSIRAQKRMWNIIYENVKRKQQQLQQ